MTDHAPELPTRPPVGQVLEFAIWATGAETLDQIMRFQREDIPQAFARVAERWCLLLGPVRVVHKKPGQERVPTVPDWVKGPDVRLIVAEAEVLAHLKLALPGVGFVQDLTADDLQTLRRITRRAHRRAHPGMPPLPDENCDAIIEAMGPEVAVSQLRAAAGATQH